MDVSVDVTATLRAGDEWSSASGDGHPAGGAGTEKTPDPALTEGGQKPAGTISRFCLRITGLMPDIQVRMRWPLPCQTGMEQEGNNVPLVSDMPESYCIAGNIIDREVQNGGNGLGCQPIYPILLRVQTVMQCSAAREVMNFCKIG